MSGENNKWLFVINPIAGGKDNGNLKKVIGQQLNGRGIEWEWFETKGENDLHHIGEKIRSSQPGVVIAGGGDGTVHMVAQHAIPDGLPVGILPLGSANGLARELEIPGEVEKALAVIEEGNMMHLDVLNIDDNLCIHLCDIGLNATVVKRFDREGYRGIFGYFLQYMKEITRVSSRKFLIREDSREKKIKALMIVATHTRMLGTGAIINPVGDPEDGSFEICIIRKFPLWMVFRIIWSLFSGNIDKLKFVKIRSSSNIEIQNVDGADFQIDGEPQSTREVIHLRTDDKPLKIFVPEKRLST